MSDGFLEQKGSGTWHFPGHLACVGLGRPGCRPYLAETGPNIFLTEFNLLFTTFSSSKHSLPNEKVNGFLTPHEPLLYNYTFPMYPGSSFHFHWLLWATRMSMVSLISLELQLCTFWEQGLWYVRLPPTLLSSLLHYTHTKSKQPTITTTNDNETPHHPIMYLILLETFSLFLK